MKVIELTKGFAAIVDDEDFAELAQYRWHVSVNPMHSNIVYAVRSVRAGRKVSMHRVILQAPAGLEVDHVNGNGLDNRRCNLRLATRTQNAQNSALQSRNKSGAKGVFYRLDRKRFRAMIRANRKSIYLGSYRTLEEAKLAYDKAAKQQHGEFARLN